MTQDLTCVVFPLGREAAPFRRRLRDVRLDPDAPRKRHGWTAQTPGGRSIRVLLCGVGPATAEQTLTRWFDAGGRTPRVILAGFAGALIADLTIGAVLRPAVVIEHSSGREWPVDGLAGASGRLVTHTAMVGQPADKAALGEKWRADAVDMEAASLARVCAERQIPFGCVRSISDRLSDSLSPELLHLIAGHGRNEVSPLRFARSILARPSFSIELWRLARATRIAADRLADELIKLIDY